MKRKFFIYIIMILGGLGEVFAQVKPDNYSFWEYSYYINPANISFGYDAFLTLDARTQWVAFPGAPITSGVTAAIPLEDIRSQIAAKIFYDRIGYTNLVDMSLSYSYSALLDRRNKLNFGVAGVFQSKSFEVRKMTIENTADPVLGSEKINGVFEGNIDLGLEYIYNNRLFIGLSAKNILSYVPSLRGGRTSPVYAPTNYLYAKYSTNYMGYSKAYLDFGASMIQYNNTVLGSFMATAVYDFENSHSASFRLFGGTAGDIGFAAGISILPDLKLLVSYNYNYWVVNQHSAGTFEIMLSYGFKKCPHCITRW